MARMGRPGLSDAQKAELWQRWKHGQSLSDIGRALSKHAGSIHGVVSAKGGIAPCIRRRSFLALTLLEREEISRGLARGMGIREIADLVLRYGAGVQVASPAGLEEACRTLIASAELRRILGQNGLKLMRDNGGATERHMEIIAQYL